MAEEKKSFVLYVDLIHTVGKLPDETAGKLLKHLLLYVNDKNPETDDILVDVVFEPIKQQLKRDLNKWEGTKVKYSDNGKIGNLKRWHKDLFDSYKDNKISLDEAFKIANSRQVSPPDKPQSPPIAPIAVNVNVNDTVNDTVNDNVNKKNFNLKDREYKPNFDKLFVKIKGRPNQDWITEVYEERRQDNETCGDNVSLFIEKTLKPSLSEFCSSCRKYGLNFFNETACLNYYKKASKGYIDDVDTWRNLLKAFKKRMDIKLIDKF